MISGQSMQTLQQEMNSLWFAFKKLRDEPKNFGVVDDEAEGIRKELRKTAEFIKSYIKKENISGKQGAQ